MEGSLRSNKDAGRKILENLNDAELLNAFLTDKYISTIPDEMFWKNRLMSKYPLTAEYKECDPSWHLDMIKPVPNTWKNYYLYVIYYADKMQREFGFKFVKGNPRWSYHLLTEAKRGNTIDLNHTLRNQILKGDEELAIHLLNYQLRRLGESPYALGSPEWEDYKNFILQTL